MLTIQYKWYNKYYTASNHPLYNRYRDQKRRCQDNRRENYNRYGKRGVKFEFENFTEWLVYVSLLPLPKSCKTLKQVVKKRFELDRIDNNGHYSKDNLRWSTPKENSNNRRNSPPLKSLQKIKNLHYKEGLPKTAAIKKVLGHHGDLKKFNSYMKRLKSES